MKLDLNLETTIVLSGILPREGSYGDVIIADNLRKRIELKPVQVELFGLTTMGENLIWNEAGKEFKQTVQLSHAEVTLLTKLLKKLDSTEKLHISLVGVYAEICLPKLEKPKK